VRREREGRERERTGCPGEKRERHAKFPVPCSLRCREKRKKLQRERSCLAAEWMNTQPEQHGSLHTLTVLWCTSLGCVEYVENRPCLSPPLPAVLALQPDRLFLVVFHLFLSSTFCTSRFDLQRCSDELFDAEYRLPPLQLHPLLFCLSSKREKTTDENKKRVRETHAVL
jgi:hypothetical protein